ncbi:MAG TPA: SRPBCC domain-containing protein [Sphingomonas sp.]|nr:SRPBCC domain-containing protein [Sphingomonas sp.]
MTPNLDDTTLEISQLFDAPAARLFDAWTSREEWQAWIGPKGVTCEVPTLNATVGGEYRVIMHTPKGEVRVAGVFREVSPPNRIAFTWGAEGDPTRQSLVTIELEPLGERTRLTLRQDGLGSADVRDEHAKGWTGAFAKLAAHVAGGAA